MKKIILPVLLQLLLVQIVWSEELIVVNKTGFPLFEVNFSPLESSEWGENLIPYDVIMPDDFILIDTDLSSDASYKIRLIDEDGEVYVKYNLNPKEQNKILIQPKDLLVLSPDQELSFTLVNRTGNSITGLYISPENHDSWGDNVLDGYLVNGEEMEIELPSGQDSAFYDIRFDLRENTYIRKHIFLSHRARILLTLQ